MESDSFISGNYNTHFVQNYFDPKKLNVSDNNEPLAAIIMASILNQDNYKPDNNYTPKTEFNSNWRKNRL